MTIVTRSRWIPFPPMQVYETLTNTDALAAIVRRIEQITIQERNSDEARVIAKLDMPGGKFVETGGQVSGIPYEKLTCQTYNPFPLQFTWLFKPVEQSGVAGTEVISSLEVDISFFVAIFSNLILNSILSAELDGDLERLEKWMGEHQGTP